MPEMPPALRNTVDAFVRRLDRMLGVDGLLHAMRVCATPTVGMGQCYEHRLRKTPGKDMP